MVGLTGIMLIVVHGDLALMKSIKLNYVETRDVSDFKIEVTDTGTRLKKLMRITGVIESDMKKASVCTTKHSEYTDIEVTATPVEAEAEPVPLENSAPTDWFEDKSKN